MKLLLIGGTGQLGGDILRDRGEHEILAPSRAQLDLTEPAQLTEAVKTFRPDAVINCAAFHNVPLCEERPDEAFRVNCVAVRDLATLCAENGTWLVTFSSDYVFSGDKREPYREDEKPGPLQIYGVTRLAGECMALAMARERAVVVRTCGLYGRSGAKSKGGNFVDGRVADARAGRRIEMACEQTIAPTSTGDLSRAVLALLGHPRLSAGIYHLVNEGSCTWYELTRAIVEITGLHTEVVPVDRGGRTGAMRRPLYSVLANTRARALGIRLRPWREALEDYLRTKYPEITERVRDGGGA
jgi:dTDP-4-dehydrorhamnose reductase